MNDQKSESAIAKLSTAEKKRIKEINYGRDAGWIMEYQNQPVALLTNCRFYDMFWDSYDVTYLTEDEALLSQLQDRYFWYEDLDKVVFRNREFQELFAAYHIITVPEGEPNTYIARGLYLVIAPEPDESQSAEPKNPSQRFLSWFWRKMTEY